jgi:non-heme chloroperoxidase
MQRRHLLQAAAGAVTGVGLAAQVHAQPTKPKLTSTIEASDGTQLFYRDWGSGAPIVFLAAWGMNSLAWQYQMVPLCDRGMRCISLDRRSHGRSADPGHGYDLDTLSDDVAGLMDHLKLTRVTLVGHSAGAAEAVRYLTRHGTARVERLVLIAPTTPFLPKTDDNPDGLDPRMIQGMRAAFATDFPGVLAANIRPFVNAGTSQALIDWVSEMMWQTPLKALLDLNRSINDADFRQELPKLKMPTLILQGDADMSAPLAITGQRTAALLPDATLKVYPGAPHGLIYTHCEQVNEDLLRFAAS